MCQYFGGKIRIGKEISKRIQEIELQVWGDNNPLYFEPFIGMAGVFRHISKNTNVHCIGCDKHVDLMIMWDNVSKGWKPPRVVSKEFHAQLKLESPSAIRAFVGFGCSYMGKFFNGYNNSALKSYNRIISVSKQFQEKNVTFMESSDYTEHSPHGMTIYCDPPYEESIVSNKTLKGFRGFNHEVFWKTMREWSKENLVVISETKAPDDFICIWEKHVGKNFYKGIGGGRYERLFCHKSYNLQTLI